MNTDVIEGNKLIAEFVVPNWELLKDKDYKGGIDTNNLYIAASLCAEEYDALKYHSSWDWLMPVWIKAMDYYRKEFGILTSTFEINNVGIIIKATHSSAFKYADIFSQDITDEEVKKSIWRAVVEFITWYNKTIKE